MRLRCQQVAFPNTNLSKKNLTLVCSCFKGASRPDTAPTRPRIWCLPLTFPSSATHMTCLFCFSSLFFWTICHLSGPTTICLSVCLCVRFSFYFMSVCLALGPSAIESNYNICEEGSSKHAIQARPTAAGEMLGYVMWCDGQAKRKALKNHWETICVKTNHNIYAFSSDHYQVDQLKTEIHIARLISWTIKLKLWMHCN